MKKTIILLILLISCISLSSCNDSKLPNVEEEYICVRSSQFAYDIIAGYKCKSIQNVDEIVIDLWYAKLDYEYSFSLEKRQDFFNNHLDEYYPEINMDEYLDYRIYSLVCYDQIKPEKDQFTDFLWREKAFEIDSLTSYKGNDYTLLNVYTIKQFSDKKIMPFDSSVYDTKINDDDVWHSEQIHLSKEYFVKNEGTFMIRIGHLLKFLKKDGLCDSVAAELHIDYKIDGDTITFSKH